MENKIDSLTSLPAKNSESAHVNDINERHIKRLYFNEDYEYSLLSKPDL